MGVSVVLLLCCGLLLSTGSKIATPQETITQFTKLLSLGQPPSEGALKFRWDNCSTISAAAVKIINGSITPDPVPLPGTITAYVAVTLTETLTSPIKAAVTLEKKLLGVYVKIPCLDNLGSCTYEDLCALIHKTTMCPPPFSTYHIPCQCPFPAGSYYLPPTEIKLPSASSVPSFLTNGDYHGKVELSDAAGHAIGCYEAYLSLKEE